ncbi:MAG: thiol:disulfide interchange protein DsbA/DsbL [Luteimonas sp.]
MTKRLALLSLLLLPLMACSRTEPSAPAADTAAAAADAPAATDAAATPATAPASDAMATPAADPAATPATPETAAAPMPAAPSGPALIAGKDYVEIPGGQPLEPRNGKVEVVEVFGFVCPACARFQPDVVAWKARLPADVRFTYVPAMFGGVWDDYARAYYAAEAMGIGVQTHEALYKAIHIDQTLKGERGRDSVEDIAGFYATHGVDAKQFTSTMASFAVAGKTTKAKQFAARTQISGTPSLVIDGKYLVKGESYADMFRIADQLIAQERGAGQ